MSRSIFIRDKRSSVENNDTNISTKFKMFLNLINNKIKEKYHIVINNRYVSLLIIKIKNIKLKDILKIILGLLKILLTTLKIIILFL